MYVLLKDELPPGCCGEVDSRESSEKVSAATQAETMAVGEVVGVEMEMCGCICNTC